MVLGWVRRTWNTERAQPAESVAVLPLGWVVDADDGAVESAQRRRPTAGRRSLRRSSSRAAGSHDLRVADGTSSLISSTIAGS